MSSIPKSNWQYFAHFLQFEHKFESKSEFDFKNTVWVKFNSQTNPVQIKETAYQFLIWSTQFSNFHSFLSFAYFFALITENANEEIYWKDELFINPFYIQEKKNISIYFNNMRITKVAVGCVSTLTCVLYQCSSWISFVKLFKFKFIFSGR